MTTPEQAAATARDNSSARYRAASELETDLARTRFLEQHHVPDPLGGGRHRAEDDPIPGIDYGPPEPVPMTGKIEQ